MAVYKDQVVEIPSVNLGSVIDAGVSIVMDAVEWDGREALISIYRSNDNRVWTLVCTATCQPTTELLKDEESKEIIFSHSRKQASRTRTYYKATIEIKGELELTKLSLN